MTTSTDTDWWRRPPDERFLSLESLLAYTEQRTARSQTTLAGNDSFVVCGSPDAGGGLWVQTDELGRLVLTNHSFGKLAAMFRLPSRWARLVAPTVGGPRLVADALNHGLVHLAPKGKVRLLVETEGSVQTLRGIAEPDHDHLLDQTVVKAVLAVNKQCGGRWEVTDLAMLYSSDRDVFIFLVEKKNPIEFNAGGKLRTLLRGFYVWSSEVGDKSFGAAPFLYDPSSGSRWTLAPRKHPSEIFEHNIGLNQFVSEGSSILRKWEDLSVRNFQGILEATSRARVDDAISWLVAKGYSRPEALAIKEAAVVGKGATVWQLAQGAAALAQLSPHTDDRLSIEKRASRLLWTPCMPHTA